jgi:hypothetical protein
MIKQVDLAGSFTLPGTSMTLNRMGYGAMQNWLVRRSGDRHGTLMPPLLYYARQ